MIVCIVLAILLVALGGYIVYDNQQIKNSLKKSANTAPTKNEKEEDNIDMTRKDLDVTDSTVVKLFNIFRVDNDCYKNIDELNTSNTYKLRLAYDNIPESERSTVSCSKVGAFFDGDIATVCDEVKNSMFQAYNNNDTETLRKIIEQENTTKSVSASSIKNKFQELYGKKYNI